MNIQYNGIKFEFIKEDVMYDGQYCIFVRNINTGKTTIIKRVKSGGFQITQ